MSELRLRKRGTHWEYSFEGARINDKRQTISKSGFRTKGEASAAGAKAMNEYNRSGSVFTPSEISVSDYLDLWMREYCLNNCKPSTISNYEKENKTPHQAGHWEVPSGGPIPGGSAKADQ